MPFNSFHFEIKKISKVSRHEKMSNSPTFENFSLLKDISFPTGDDSARQSFPLTPRGYFVSYVVPTKAHANSREKAGRFCTIFMVLCVCVTKIK